MTWSHERVRTSRQHGTSKPFYVLRCCAIFLDLLTMRRELPGVLSSSSTIGSPFIWQLFIYYIFILKSNVGLNTVFTSWHICVDMSNRDPALHHSLSRLLMNSNRGLGQNMSLKRSPLYGLGIQRPEVKSKLWRIFCQRISVLRLAKERFFLFLSQLGTSMYWVPPVHLLLDGAPNLGPLICRWDIHKFENCWYKSVRILEVLKLLFQQFLNSSSSQRNMSGPILGDLSNNRWSWVPQASSSTGWNICGRGSTASKFNLLLYCHVLKNSPPHSSGLLSESCWQELPTF